MANVPPFNLHKAIAAGALHVACPEPISASDYSVEGLERHLDSFRKAPKFIISPDAFTMLEQMGHEARQSVLTGMAEMGIFRLPFPEIVVQVTHRGRDKGPKEVFILYRQLDDDTMNVDASMIVQRDDREKFGIMPLYWRIEPQVSGGFMNVYTYQQVDWFHNDKKADASSVWVQGNKERNRIVAEGLATVVLLLATRGIAKERMDAPERLNKKRLQARKEPLYSHTVLRLHPKLKHLEGKTYRDSEGRAMPRLHWRIGHKREQRFGPKLSQTKTIWIDGQIVGADANGIVTHDYAF